MDRDVARSGCDLSAAVSEFTGIVAGTSRGMHTLDGAPLPQASAHTTAWFRVRTGRQQLSPFRRSYDGANRLPYARGASVHPSVAHRSAVAEALERYAASFLPDEAVLLPWRALDKSLRVPLADFQIYSERQLADPAFPYRGLTADTSVRWVSARRLRDGTPKFLPAQLVYLTSAPMRLVPMEPPIVEQTSSGLACAFDVAQASTKAVFELVERDALMLVWLRKLSLPRLQWQGSQVCSSFMKAYVERSRLDCHFVDLSGFHGVPSVLAVVIGHTGGSRHVSYGSAAAASIQYAWRRALTEALMSREWLRTRVIGTSSAVTGLDVVTVEAHAIYDHCHGAPGLDFLLAGDQRRRIDDVAPIPCDNDAVAQLSWLGARLRHSGSEVYLTDVTTPDVAELGARVVRAVAPALVRMYFDHRASPYGLARVRAAASVLNADARDRAGELNEEPHPFA